MNTNDASQPAQRGIEPPATEQPTNSAQNSPLPESETQGLSPHSAAKADEGKARHMTQRASKTSPSKNQPQKPQNKPNRKISEKRQLAQIKRAWKKLPLKKQESWLAQAVRRGDPMPILVRIEKEFHIKDVILMVAVRFRRWLRAEHAARRHAVTLAVTEQKIRKKHPKWPLNRVREKLLRNAYDWSDEFQDFNTGFKTISAHCRTQSVQLDDRRYEDSKRSDEEKALQFCLDATRKYPEVQVLFKQAFAGLEKATAGK